MTAFDLSRLGAWRQLPFFDQTLPLIEAALAQETRPVYPPKEAVFHALERTQPQDTRVVILGQDPYHTHGKADGLAFSIPTDFGGRLDSLGNIFKEIKTDLNISRTRTDLSDWADQGVLMFNALALTVPEGKPKGHLALGWQTLTQQVLTHLATQPRAYLLWGSPAHNAVRDVVETSIVADGRMVSDRGNLIIKTVHPSPLSAYRGFLGSRPFSQTNEWLKANALAPINWGDPEGP